MNTHIDHQRRAILIASLTSGGALMIGTVPAWAVAPGSTVLFKPNAFVRINPDSTVTVTLPYVEMGQGAYTSQAMVVAEELEVAPSKIVLEPAPADEKLYGSPLFGGQITGGSGSMRGTWMTMRAASAAARIMLVRAAAQQWGVEPAQCEALDGEVHHRASGRKLRYGELVQTASRLPVPAEPPLKKPGTYKLIGKPLMRLDTPSKVNGTAQFGIDVRRPGMRYATVAACPFFNGKLGSVNSTAAMKIKGVRQIVKLPDAVAVVADSTWSAFKGLAALDIEWTKSEDAAVDTAELMARADAALKMPGLAHMNVGDVAAAEKQASKSYDATFRLPAMAHAAIEPLNCTVHVRRDRCDVWCGSQIVGRAQKVAAEAARMPLERVHVHNLLLGGGFGRRLEVDYVAQAVRIGRQVNAPVKVTWSRTEDLQHDYYRGHNHSRVRVALDNDNHPLSWRHHVVGPAVMARWLPVYQKDNIDLDVVHGAYGPYDIPNVYIDFTRTDPPAGMNVGNWRGVGPTRNVFIVESVIDDLASRAKRDPLQYRRALMNKAPIRIRRVMDLAAEKAGWAAPLTARKGRGIAVYDGFGSFAAVVAQVAVNQEGEVAVERLTCAVDAGVLVNPDIVRAQIEGGLIFGLSAVLMEHVDVQDSRVTQANYDTYPILRMQSTPQIDVHLVESTEDPGGVGELGTPGAIAAVANAVFAATGVRAYSLPLDPVSFKVRS